MKKKAKSFFNSMFKDIPNVFTQHKSYLVENILPDLVSGRLKESEYPIAFHRDDVNFHAKPTIIVFQIGGTTFTESAECAQFG